jgi:hypothetical protein
VAGTRVGSIKGTSGPVLGPENKVETMSNIRRLAALSLAAVMVPASLVPAIAADACETYGKLALQQQKDNEQLKCGLSGNEWSADLKAHIKWCSEVSAQDWQAMLKKRQDALAACKSKS